MRITIEWPMYTVDDKGEDVETIYEVTCGLTKGEAQSYDYAGSDPECDIEEIELQGLGKQPGIKLDPILWPLLGFNQKVFDQIQEKAFETASDREEGAKADWADAERERRLERD
jgi:hypothetical protein